MTEGTVLMREQELIAAGWWGTEGCVGCWSCSLPNFIGNPAVVQFSTPPGGEINPLDYHAVALCRDPNREIERGQLINSFLCLSLPLSASQSHFRWVWGAELVLAQPRTGCSRLGAAFWNQLRAEVAPRDQSSGRHTLGKTNLGAANICGCDCTVLSEGEGRLWREPRPKIPWFFFISWHGEQWEVGITPAPPWALTPRRLVIAVAAHFKPFLKGLPVSLRCPENAELP